MTKKSGFTLAEVLITLGIIGVVAAMTIPTLIANTNSSKFRSQFKKSISTLSQAGLMAQAQYDYDFAGTNANCSSDPGKDDPESVSTFCAILNGTLTGKTAYKALSDIKAKSGSYSLKAANVKNAAITNVYAYSLADGSVVAFPKSAQACTLKIGESLTSVLSSNAVFKRDCVGFIDVNGATLPNKEVTCETGTTDLTPDTPCTVPNDANHMTDIFPIVFHDATVEPATNAAKYILTTSK